ncbi:MAG: hypothetical protein Q8L57_01885 [bacterium]|nr:hypothetical protein [bacterium]
MTFEQLKTEQNDPAPDKFRGEIQRLKEEEEQEFERLKVEGGSGSIHLRGLETQNLTGEDAAVYEKFKNLELTETEFYDWRQKITSELGKKAPAKSAEREEFFARDSRYIFMQYVANKIGFWQPWEEKRKEFELFRQKIDLLREEEIGKMERKEQYDPHLVSILNSKHLTPRDMEIMKKFEGGSLKDNSDEFREYRQEIFQECHEHFRQKISKHKKLREFIEKPLPEEDLTPPEVEVKAYARFQSIFSRSNFLAWMHNKMFEAALRESRERRHQKQKEAEQQ